ncbi:MAG TPA: hypothetical protein VF014_04025 [Casimicrobiaceae bacterium]|jgi:hypothetical protein|nr:hypothetical protein [Casimicrobiaceae bacterium]
MVSPYQAAAGIQKERTSIFPLAVWSLFSVNASNVAAFCSAAAGCTKGRFFDRVSDKLSQLARFATNELVSFDLQAMASALTDEVTSKPDGALPTDLSAGLRAVNVHNSGARVW